MARERPRRLGLRNPLLRLVIWLDRRRLRRAIRRDRRLDEVAERIAGLFADADEAMLVDALGSGDEALVARALGVSVDELWELHNEVNQVTERYGRRLTLLDDFPELRR
jgi:hypothetical protein